MASILRQALRLILIQRSEALYMLISFLRFKGTMFQFFNSVHWTVMRLVPLYAD